ncbi:NUDIX domain-containing protein [Cerasibacillus terrae]|uniref:NUDIX domain-containing protein n=1 Tax=Cerasibacillus terrae TaxID=2498845 RepID=A0A5C8NRK9_9BACI|nr:NUDIX domain-containing protein [Cerasibacillus terrae]TXL63650.1 NUDIX domain-containing protein [Cerasibacillus terrae]
MVNNIPRVGVGAVILNEKQSHVLLVLRKKAPEAGYWSLPGGKVEFMETIEHAVKREIKEELGVDIHLENLLCVTNHLLPNEQTHWVAPTFISTIHSGIVRNMEPDKLGDVQWFPLENLPQKITMTTKNAFKYI